MTQLVKISRNSEAFWCKVLSEVKGNPQAHSRFKKEDKLYCQVDSYVKNQPFGAGDEIFVYLDEIIDRDTI